MSSISEEGPDILLSRERRKSDLRKQTAVRQSNITETTQPLLNNEPEGSYDAKDLMKRMPSLMQVPKPHA